ncbi:3-beta hydroxysteroid dehydrogenase/isomerase [Thalassoporum mexicanum PCC 7367]|uniref:NAD(P)H-binding protein n=1 Tax=Thalassoporum mexicanum TaxID=3457544 RepID=UPI00029FA349|nr:NAD(P)H-binding protein [Pseudanabaena sp. PCC 7367]AFY70444.1 3-beta hydroxysteroid dehydrogenase/isomerase [Pseudanabaena sp. PCC 7367]
MSLLIVGATGTLGRQIARCALDRGLKVKCFVRNPQKAAFLKEWGAELVVGNLMKPQTIDAALEDVDAVIDAATARANDSLRIRDVDWDGKVALIKAIEKAGIKRFIFFSIMHADRYPHVPLMDIKYCTEKLIQATDLDYTILRPCGFLQGLIGQYAIPILEKQTIWITGEASPIAYLDTQDIAKFAINALDNERTYRNTFAIAGPRAWTPSEILRQCERFSGNTARTANMPIGLLRFVRKLTQTFEWGWNIADRLAFTEVLASGVPLTAEMDETCEIFGIPQDQLTSLESYLQEYFSRILRKLKELDYKEPKVKTPF